MLFPTTVFAVFFFLVFNLHWALAGYPRTRKGFLLLASLFFYGFWSWKFALMLLGSALVNHAAAVWMERLSAAFTAAAWTLISTSLSPGTGFSASRYSSASGRLLLSYTTAFMSVSLSGLPRMPAAPVTLSAPLGRLS